MSKKMLPRVVYQLCVHGGLLVGSFARKISGEPDLEFSDFDVLVPHEQWQIAALIIPPDATPNKFGGWTFVTDWGDDSVEVDVWPGSLHEYLKNCATESGKVCAVDFIGNRTYMSTQRTIIQEK